MQTQSNWNFYESPMMPGDWSPEDLAMMEDEELALPFYDEDFYALEFEEEELQAEVLRCLEDLYCEEIEGGLADSDWQQTVNEAFLASLDF